MFGSRIMIVSIMKTILSGETLCFVNAVDKRHRISMFLKV